MASTQVNPTRMELTRLKKKRITAIRGHKLLKDKRDELMRQYLDLVRENMEVRLRVEKGILSANKNFVIAKAGMSEAALNTALMAPKQEINQEAGEKNVMSVNIPTFEYKTRTADENDIYSYGFAFTSSDLDGAVKSLADILPDMIRLAECEKACRLPQQSGTCPYISADRASGRDSRRKGPRRSISPARHGSNDGCGTGPTYRDACNRA